MVRRCLQSASVRVGLALLAGGLSTGCVTVYQPLVSLQRPVAIDPELANFEGARLRVRCVPGDYIDEGDSEQLCRQVGTLFTNQGAKVDTEVPREGFSGGSEDVETAGEKKAELVIDLKARLLHQENSKVLWILSGMSFTLIPAVTEYSFAQDVVIRDASGFLLAQDTLQGRFVRYFGAGVWAVNGALDLLVRPAEEKLTGDAAKRDFSKDFYGQLSQLAFQARMRSTVLHGFEPPRADGAK